MQLNIKLIIKLILLTIFIQSCKTSKIVDANDISEKEIYNFINDFFKYNPKIKYVYSITQNHIYYKDKNMLDTTYLFNDEMRSFMHYTDSLSFSNFITYKDINYMKKQNTKFKLDIKKLNRDLSFFKKPIFDRNTGVYDPREYILISKPLFSLDKKYCIFVTYRYSKYDDGGILTLYKKEKEEWVKVNFFSFYPGFNFKF